MEDGIIRLLPTAAQWRDFPGLLEFARSLGAENDGICKVLLPKDIPGRKLLASHNAVKRKGWRYSSNPDSNGTFEIERKEADIQLQSSLEPSTTNLSSSGELVQRFEQLLQCRNGLVDARYCTDLDIRTSETRTKIGLPSDCPISRLNGDCLVRTKKRVPGIHWPYAYQAGCAFGAPFTMHVEDFWLISINYLYAGEKVWVIVAPKHYHRLEAELKGRPGFEYRPCEQFLRHSPKYIPLKTLDEWGVSYRIVRQKNYEVIITFPKAYHEGFSTGYTFAVAVNYADKEWKYDGYRDCRKGCPPGYIPREMMLFLCEGEEQRQLDDSDGEEEPEEDMENNKCKQNEDDRNDGVNNPSREQNNMAAKPRAKAKSVKHTKSLRQRDGILNTPNSIKEGFKRKSSGCEVVTTGGKRLKMQIQIDGNPECFEELQRVQESRIQTAEIYKKILNKYEKQIGLKDAEPKKMEIWLATRLFFAIASSDAFYQLRCACAESRAMAEGSLMPEPTNNVADILKALDSLDSMASTNASIRRYHLTNLCQRRGEREKYHQNERPKQVTRKLKNTYSRPAHTDVQHGIMRTSSFALDDMMAEAYPKTKRPSKNTHPSDSRAQMWNRKYKALKNRISSGRNWHLMRQRFSPGILTLIPIDGIYDIQNSE